MKKYSIISFMKPADIMTLFNGLFGFFSIILAIKGEYYFSVYCMIISTLLDFFDGKVARRFGGSTSFGKALDFSDIISFGLAPAIFVSMIYPTLITYAVSTIFISCGILRLTRFMATDTRFSIGMPITLNGILFPITFFIIDYFKLPLYYFLILMIISSILMFSSKKIEKKI